METDLALVGAKIYPSPKASPIIGGVVLIRNGKITAVGKKGKIKIPSRAKVIDCKGLILTSGFWNNHVHFIETIWENSATIPASKLTQQLQVMLTKYGFVTVFDTGSVWAETNAIRRRIESGEIQGPRIFTVGEILSQKGGLSPELLKSAGFLSDAVIEVSGQKDGEEKSRQHVKKDVDAVKIYAATYFRGLVEMSPVTLEAIVKESRRGGKLVFVHPYNQNGAEAAINAGIDVFAHTLSNGKFTNNQLKRMKRQRIALIPTLRLWKVEAGREGMSVSETEEFINSGVKQLRDYSKIGGQILFGTDVGYIDYDPTEEYIFMEQAELSFRQILESLTTAPAKRFGLSKTTGKIARGMDADIVLLSNDPATDVKAFSSVRYTIRAGKIIYQSD